MAIKDKSVRETQVASCQDAVAKRYALLKEKGCDGSVIQKDPILRHLKAELSRRQKRLAAAAPKVKPKPEPKVEAPKEEAKPKEKPKKKEKAKKAAPSE